MITYESEINFFLFNKNRLIIISNSGKKYFDFEKIYFSLFCEKTENFKIKIIFKKINEKISTSSRSLGNLNLNSIGKMQSSILFEEIST